MRTATTGAACLLIALLVSIPAPTAADEPAPRPAAPAPAASVEFNRDVRHIQATTCSPSPHPDDAKRTAGMRLDRKDDARAVRKGRTPLSPGSLDKSEVWARISAEEDSQRMPPAAFGKPLSKAEIDTLKRW